MRHIGCKFTPHLFLLLLFFGGIVLDKFGIRFTGIMSTTLMFVGALIKWYAVSHTFEGMLFGYQTQVIIACLGFATYGVGCEIVGITATKVIAKWFTGHELALAMEARCYHGGDGRTRMKALQYSGRDAFAGVCCLCMAAGAFLTRFIRICVICPSSA